MKPRSQKLSIPRFALIASLAISGAAGCGPLIYTVNALGAAEAVDNARQAGAAANAPYEFYYALAHYEYAREEAGEGEYQRASEMCETAVQYGNRARDLARRRGQESGRR